MKKLYVFCLMLVMCSLALVGCGKDSDKGNTAGEGTDVTASDVNAKKEPITIEYWYGLGSVAGETMQAMVEEFNASQDEVIVKPVSQASYDETFQKLQAAMASNTAPAVFISDKVLEHAKRGLVAPLNEDANNANIDLDDYLEVFMKPSKIDDTIYGIPAYGTTQVVYYRKDILEKNGKDPKEVYSTWENVFKTSKELQAAGEVKFGHLHMWGPENLIDIAQSNGGQVISDDGKTVMINSPEWIESWDFVRGNVFAEKTTKINSGGQGWEYWYRTIDDVLSGDSLSYTGSSGDKGDLDFSIIDSIPQPGLNGKPGKPQAAPLYLTIPSSVSAEERAAGMQWIKFFTSPENSAKWSQKIGYIPVRKSAMEVKEYKEFIAEHPYAAVPYQQALTAMPSFIDPTSGKIYDLIKIAADKIELENISAKEALDEAQKKAQVELDKSNKGN